MLATIHYLENKKDYKIEKPYHINLPAWALPPGKQTNESSVAYDDISVTDLRMIKDQFSLDVNGFYVEREDLRGPFSLVDCLRFDDYSDPALVRQKALPAVEGFLKRKLPGVEDAIAFSHQIRRRDAKFPALPRGTQGQVPQPVQGVHVGMRILNRQVVTRN